MNPLAHIGEGSPSLRTRVALDLRERDMDSPAGALFAGVIGSAIAAMIGTFAAGIADIIVNGGGDDDSMFSGSTYALAAVLPIFIMLSITAYATYAVATTQVPRLSYTKKRVIKEMRNIPAQDRADLRPAYLAVMHSEDSSDQESAARRVFESTRSVLQVQYSNQLKASAAPYIEDAESHLRALRGEL